MLLKIGNSALATYSPASYRQFSSSQSTWRRQELSHILIAPHCFQMTPWLCYHIHSQEVLIYQLGSLSNDKKALCPVRSNYYRAAPISLLRGRLLTNPLQQHTLPSITYSSVCTRIWIIFIFSVSNQSFAYEANPTTQLSCQYWKRNLTI